MSKPPEILALEKVYGITLEETKDEDDIMHWENSNLYLLNEESQVIGLNLIRNQISEIKNLDKFIHLQHLNISDNQISKIENLNKLTNISILDISYNKIAKIENLDKLTNISKLDISYNKIAKIENLDQLTNISILDISKNQITKIENLEKLTNISTLDISKNKIAKIENLEKLTNISRLNISDNKIAKIENLDKLTNISELDILDNQIAKIENLDKLTNISTLDISYNKIAKIENLDQLTNISTLDILDNQIAKIENLEKLTNISTLDISYNKIAKIENLDKLTNISTLDISDNKIVKIENLDKLTNISELAISDNKIEKIENLDKLTNISRLYISDNKIAKIENLDKLTNISELAISDNQIEKIENLDKLTNISRLIISNNKIAKIDDVKEILNLQTLQYLSIHNNPFLDEAHSLILNEYENHLESIKNELYKLEENIELIQLPVKVMLLGNHASGKSTLLQYIRTKSFRKSNRSTHVLSVIPSRKKINFKLPKAIFYDFGGQDYYHGVYQAFFTQEAVNVLVWNPTSDANVLLEKDSNELPTRNYNRMYWLAQLQYSFLKRFGSLDKYNDPLLLVQTFADEHLLKKNWNEAYSQHNILEEFHISLKEESKNQRNTAALRYLEDLFWEVVTTQTTTEKKPEWFPAFLNYILKNKQKEKYISLTEISQQFEREKLSEADKIKFLKEDLEQLARKGMLLYYKNDAELADIAWLNPAAIVKYIHKTILSKKSIQNKKGKLTDAEFTALKVDEKIRRLLLNEKVLFHDAINKEYIIPNYLPLTSEDDEIYDLLKFDFNNPTFVLKFERFIPFGLINQLICHYGQNPDKKHYWRDQLIFTIDKQFKVWIQLDFSKLTISVSIKPKQAKDPKLNEVTQQIFREIIFLYWSLPLSEFDEKGTLKELEKDPNISETDSKRMIKKFHKIAFSETTKPKDLYLSTDGKHFVHYNTLDNPKKTQESIVSYALPEDKNDLDKTNPRSQRSYKYRNFTDNENIKKMKKIFISYSRKDVEYKDELRKHLNMLKLFDVADNWSCEDITIGKWHDQIQKELDESDLVIFMLSINFFSSDYILDEEVINTMNKIAAGSEKKVLCVIVSKFAGLENFDASTMNSRQKAIIKLASFQYASYFKEENKLTGNNEERLISLKEASRLGILDKQLTKVMEKIMKEIK